MIKMVSTFKIIALSSLLMLTCHIATAHACESSALEKVRFTAAHSFAAGEDYYTLSDMVHVEEGAQAFANTWVKNKRLKTVPIGGSEADRYGRCSVYLLEEGTNHSLQYALVREGLAIGYNERGNRFSHSLLKAEAEARNAKKGVWKQGNMLISADDAYNHIGRFVIVEGVVKNIYNHKKGHVMLNFGEDWKTDFTAFIPNFSAKKFKKEVLEDIKDKKIEIRGILYEKNGPSLSILNQKYLKILAK